MMSNTQPEYIFNPYSRRTIMIGGRVFKRLIKQGLLNPNTQKFTQWENPKPPEILPKREISVEPIESLIEDFSGKKIDGEKLSELVAEASENVLNEHKQELSKIYDDEELYEEVRLLINEELKELLKKEAVIA